MIRIREVSMGGEVIGKMVERTKFDLLRHHNRLSLHIGSRNGQPGVHLALKKAGDAGRHIPEGASLGPWVITKPDA